jgi:hypothetical protein
MQRSLASTGEVLLLHTDRSGRVDPQFPFVFFESFYFNKPVVCFLKLGKPPNRCDRAEFHFLAEFI